MTIISLTANCIHRKGGCWDNVPTESLWSSLEVCRLYGKRFETMHQAMEETINWLMLYSYRRLHSTLSFINPVQFEQNWFAAESKDAAS